jgi:hypothetical protein
MATRRPEPCISAPRSELAGDQVVGLADRLDALELFLGHLDPELLLERHHELDEVEAVGVEVVPELGLGRDVFLVDREHLDGALAKASEQFLIHEGSPCWVGRVTV